MLSRRDFLNRPARGAVTGVLLDGLRRYRIEQSNKTIIVSGGSPTLVLKEVSR